MFGVYPKLSALNKKDFQFHDMLILLKQCQTQSIFGDTVYLCYYKLRLVIPSPPLPSSNSEG